MDTSQDFVPDKQIEQSVTSTTTTEGPHHHQHFSVSSAPSSIAPESLSPASSLLSLASTHSSGICPDSAPGSPDNGQQLQQQREQEQQQQEQRHDVHVEAFDAVPENDPNTTSVLVADTGREPATITNSSNGSSSSFIVLAEEQEEELRASAAALEVGVEAGADATGADLSQDQTFTSAADGTIAEDDAISCSRTESAEDRFGGVRGDFEASRQDEPVLSRPTDDETFKVPYPVKQQQQQSQQQQQQQQPPQQQDHPSSVITHDAQHDDRLLCNQRTDLEEFRSALTSLQTTDLPQFCQRRSPTSFIDSDARLGDFSIFTNNPNLSFSSALSRAGSPFGGAGSEGKEPNDAIDFHTITTGSGEVSEYNSLVLNSELEKYSTFDDLNLSTTKLLERFGSLSLDTWSDKECNQTDIKIPKQEEFLSNEVESVVKKEIETSEKEIGCVQEAESLDATKKIIEPETNTSNRTQDLPKEDSIFGKTAVSNLTEILSKTEDIIPCEVFLNVNETATQKTNVLNKTQDIIPESNLLNKSNIVNEAEVIGQELNIENKLDVQNKNELNKSEVNVEQINNNVNTLDVLHKESHELNKTNSLPDKETDTVNLNCTVLIQDTDCIEKNPAIESVRENQLNNENSKQLVQQEQEKIYNKINENIPQQETKSELFVQQEIIPSGNFLDEESQNSNLRNDNVVASTPLPTKICKREVSSTTKRKSALFATEPHTTKSEGFDLLRNNSNSSHLKDITQLIEDDKENIINLQENDIVHNNSFKKSPSALEVKAKDNLELTHILPENVVPSQEPDYEAFKPQQQSTTLLPYLENCDHIFQEAALSVAKNIDASIEKIEENEHFVSATAELFEDPAAFDFFDQVGSENCKRSERYDSLYMTFDPLAQRLSMMPQKNVPSPLADEQSIKNSKEETAICNMGTPKKNPAIAAIDRLLFYSPCAPTSTESEVAEANEKTEEVEKVEPEPEQEVIPVVDEKMVKELELVRSTVLQLEAELENQKVAYEDKINHMQTKFSQMQTQLTQEVNCKEQMTVVVEEYEKSISRLISEREKDRASSEAEKAKLQEELQVATQHLSNTEAAFNDVHSKYERLKHVISVYKSNEAVLKESIAENQETIKTLENRYEQLKSHAMAQLEKANLELSGIKKHNDAEIVKLKALVRRAELKSKSLEETVEQKLKENKELTQIIDDMIARVN